MGVLEGARWQVNQGVFLARAHARIIVLPCAISILQDCFLRIYRIQLECMEVAMPLQLRVVTGSEMVNYLLYRWDEERRATFYHLEDLMRCGQGNLSNMT